MNNIKRLLTVSLVIASVSITSASNYFSTLRNLETTDTKDGNVSPANRPSTNHLEKNTNAKLMAKQLLKSASANAILGKTANILERYGYHNSANGTFFSNSDAAIAGSPTESFTIMSMSHNERGDVVRVRVESNKDLQVYLSTESGLGVPFGLMNLGENEIFISPSYVLSNGSYIIRLRSNTGERKLKLIVEQRELLGKK